MNVNFQSHTHIAAKNVSQHTRVKQEPMKQSKTQHAL